MCASRLLTGLCLSLLAGVLSAQAPPRRTLDDELAAVLNTPVEVSSSRREGMLSTPSTVSVIRRDLLERFGIQTLAQAVDLVAGMAVHRTIFNADVPTARGVLQEGYANRILLLINGVSTWNAMTGDHCLPRVDIEDVDRIEVLRGPASVLYGTNAYAGAINVILLRRSTESQAHLGPSSRGGYGLGFSHSHQTGDMTLFVSANQRLARGHGMDLQGEGESLINLNDFRRSRSANLSLGYRGHGLLANVFEETAPLMGSTFTGPSGGGRDLRNKGALAGYQFDQPFSKDFRLKYAFAFDGSQRVFTGSQDQTRVYLQRGARLTHSVMALWNLSDSLGLEMGGARETRQNAHYTLFNPSDGSVVLEALPRGLSKNEASAYLQVNYARGPWAGLLGARYTRNDNFGSNLSSRASVVCKLTERQSLKFLWGQSFRAPALLEQYLAIPRVAFGKEDLDPETSSTFEVAYLHATENAFLQVLAYQSEFRNKLYRTRRYPVYTGDATDFSVIYQNGRTFRGRGVELEARYQRPGGLMVFLNMDYTRGDRGDEFAGSRGFNYQFVPPLNGRLGVSQVWKGWTGAFMLRHQDGARGPLGPVAGWTSLDAHVAYSRGIGGLLVRHSLHVNGLADRERWFPEYTRRNANRVPEGMGRQVGYTLSVAF